MLRGTRANARCVAAERQIGRAGDLSENALHHGVHPGAISQARLADDRDRLTRAFLRLLPAIVQQAHLVISPGERGQADSRRDLNRIAIYFNPVHGQDFGSVEKVP